MKEIANEYQNSVWSSELPSMINKLCSVIWSATAEICERLDDQSIKQDNLYHLSQRGILFKNE